MRFAYADPPYLGLASYYDHPETLIWDDPETHRRLFARLEAEYDGWAYSLHSPDFCRWVLDLIGWRPGDEIVDLFPGTGIMGVVSGVTPLQTGLFVLEE